MVKMVKMVKIEITFGREKMPGGGATFRQDEDANLALVPGMEVEVSLFLGTHEYNGDIYNDIYYKSLKVLS